MRAILELVVSKGNKVKLKRGRGTSKQPVFALLRFASQENERSDTSTKCEVAFGRAVKRSQTCDFVAPLRLFCSVSLRSQETFLLRKKRFPCFTLFRFAHKKPVSRYAWATATLVFIETCFVLRTRTASLVLGYLNAKMQSIRGLSKIAPLVSFLPILKEFIDLELRLFIRIAWKSMMRPWDYCAKANYGVKHCKNEFLNGKNHINKIENFWSYCKDKMAKFRGI